MDDLTTSFAKDDLEENISLALLQRLHKSGAVSDRHPRAALRKVAGDLIERLLALESIDADQLGEAFHEVILESKKKRRRKVAPN